MSAKFQKPSWTPRDWLLVLLLLANFWLVYTGHHQLEGEVGTLVSQTARVCPVGAK